MLARRSRAWIIYNYVLVEVIKMYHPNISLDNISCINSATKTNIFAITISNNVINTNVKNILKIYLVYKNKSKVNKRRKR